MLKSSRVTLQKKQKRPFAAKECRWADWGGEKAVSDVRRRGAKIGEGMCAD